MGSCESNRSHIQCRTVGAFFGLFFSYGLVVTLPVSSVTSAHERQPQPPLAPRTQDDPGGARPVSLVTSTHVRQANGQRIFSHSQ